mmetsp:Transcript_88415/g.197677  ORF Transcript_88415/g.197677 Transcript_88415/m.197677 type:complete len:95 (+) Transcript_88415:10-294(+)
MEKHATRTMDTSKRGERRWCNPACLGQGLDWLPTPSCYAQKKGSLVLLGLFWMLLPSPAAAYTLSSVSGDRLLGVWRGRLAVLWPADEGANRLA